MFFALHLHLPFKGLILLFKGQNVRVVVVHGNDFLDDFFDDSLNLAAPSASVFFLVYTRLVIFFCVHKTRLCTSTESKVCTWTSRQHTSAYVSIRQHTSADESKVSTWTSRTTSFGTSLNTTTSLRFSIMTGTCLQVTLYLFSL